MVEFINNVEGYDFDFFVDSEVERWIVYEVV